MSLKSEIFSWIIMGRSEYGYFVDYYKRFCYKQKIYTIDMVKKD